MGWMDEYYRTIRLHNEGKCVPEDCRHCKTEKATRERVATAIVKAKVLSKEVTGLTKISASYNGGGDEDFVDFIYCYNGDQYKVYDVYKEHPAPLDNIVQTMTKIAWGILGHGFGVGDFSIAGDITLDLLEGKLYNKKHLIADLKEE